MNKLTEEQRKFLEWMRGEDLVTPGPLGNMFSLNEYNDVKYVLEEEVYSDNFAEFVNKIVRQNKSIILKEWKKELDKSN